jgi:hypothetical protein
VARRVGLVTIVSSCLSVHTIPLLNFHWRLLAHSRCGNPLTHLVHSRILGPTGNCCPPESAPLCATIRSASLMLITAWWEKHRRDREPMNTGNVFGCGRCSAMIYSARRILSGLAGFALLAMPVSAAAHDHRDVHHQSPPLATARPASAREWHPAVARPSSAVGPHFSHPALGRPAVFNPPHKFDLPRTQVVAHPVAIGFAPVSRVATARVIGDTLPPVRVPPSRVWRGRPQPPVSLPAVQVAQPMPPVMHPAWTHDQFLIAVDSGSQFFRQKRRISWPK